MSDLVFHHDMYTQANDDDYGYSPYVAIRWMYMTSDPFAIQLIFPDTNDPNGGEISWRFARDLIASGLVADEPFGLSDVKVWHGYDDKLHITLSNPEGTVQLIMDRQPVLRFARRIYNAVPEGCEQNFVDIDAQLASLLS
jgi:hypothetical protein